MTQRTEKERTTLKCGAGGENVNGILERTGSHPGNGEAGGRRLRRARNVLLAGLIFLIVGTGVLWVDSRSKERVLIFLPGGDVGYGFRTHERQISYVEHAPWMASPNLEILTFPLAGVLILEASILLLWIVGRFRKPSRPRD